MAFSSALLWVVLILQLIHSSNGQICEIWNNDPPECAPVLQSYIGKPNVLHPNGTMNSTIENSQSIYVLSLGGNFQQTLSLQAKSQIAQFNNPLVPPACRSILIEFTCLEVFRRCVGVETSTNGTNTTTAFYPSQT